VRQTHQEGSRPRFSKWRTVSAQAAFKGSGQPEDSSAAFRTGVLQRNTESRQGCRVDARIKGASEHIYRV